MLGRKKGDFRMFIASSVQHRFRNVMITTMQKQEVNEIHQQ